MEPSLEFYRELKREADTKILLVVADGLGGLPRAMDGTPTELEAARTPYMDGLAQRSVLGLHQPVAPGVTPGSGPGHLGLFGYDPLRYQVGRGVLSALGIGIDLAPGQVAARGNFCTMDESGAITDRRAGRISTDKTRELLGKLEDIEVEGASIRLEPVKDYRFCLILEGEGLGDDLQDTDPHIPGKKPHGLEPGDDASRRTARMVESFVEQVRERLAGEEPANMVLLRGFSSLPDWPGLENVWGVRAGAVAAYPMYRGVSRLVGMDVLGDATDFDQELDVMRSAFDGHDFIFLHMKPSDSAGEDGDFDRKVAHIERLDQAIPELLELEPDVLVITGDHSTPAAMSSHSFHPVPLLLHSKLCRPDGSEAFGERECVRGGLGANLPAHHIMPIMMGHAGRLDKFGA